MKAIIQTPYFILLGLLFLVISSCKKDETYADLPLKVYITNKPAAGASTFTKAVSAAESATPGVARVYLNKLAETDITVTVSFSGTATAGVDYTQPPTTVTIPAGQYFAEIIFPIIDDTAKEPAETIIVTAVSASGGYLPGLGTASSNATFTYTITAND